MKISKTYFAGFTLAEKTREGLCWKQHSPVVVNQLKTIGFDWKEPESSAAAQLILIANEITFPIGLMSKPRTLKAIDVDKIHDLCHKLRVIAEKLEEYEKSTTKA